MEPAEKTLCSEVPGKLQARTGCKVRFPGEVSSEHLNSPSPGHQQNFQFLLLSAIEASYLTCGAQAYAESLSPLLSEGKYTGSNKGQSQGKQLQKCSSKCWTCFGCTTQPPPSYHRLQRWYLPCLQNKPYFRVERWGRREEALLVQLAEAEASWQKVI